MNFQMSSQIAGQNRCIVALVAFEGRFPSVSFQKSSQIACQNRCIVALLANRMSEQMLSHIGWWAGWGQGRSKFCPEWASFLASEPSRDP